MDMSSKIHQIWEIEDMEAHFYKNTIAENPSPLKNILNFTQSQPLTNSTNNANSTAAPIVCQREGGLSPTSNQLAQWFSPELLAQASAGKLPQINMNQALSLEEFERNIQQHSSTVVHN